MHRSQESSRTERINKGLSVLCFDMWTYRAANFQTLREVRLRRCGKSHGLIGLGRDSLFDLAAVALLGRRTLSRRLHDSQDCDELTVRLIEEDGSTE